MKRKEILEMAARFEMDAEGKSGAEVYDLFFALPRAVKEEINRRGVY